MYRPTTKAERHFLVVLKAAPGQVSLVGRSVALLGSDELVEAACDAAIHAVADGSPREFLVALRAIAEFQRITKG